MNLQARILVADDQNSMRTLMASALRGLGFVGIAMAEDGIQVLDVLKRDKIDLLLLDGEMPRLDGIETLKTIRETEATKNLPVVLVTGRADAAFVKKVIAYAPNGLLLKPVSSAALSARIAPLLPG